MKTLLILRHAKAQPDAPEGDRHRKLTARGKRNASAIGQKMRELNLRPDLILSSDAKRARQTARIVADELDFGGLFLLEPTIYDADLDDLLQLVRRLPDDADRVIIVGHNPGFQELADALSEEGSSVDDLPTAGLVHLQFETGSWRNAREGTGRLVDIYRPKEL